MSETNGTQHLFDQAIALCGEPNKRIAKVSPAYQNMVGPFGGITAAKILHAILKHPEREGSPISLTVNYLGPINSDEVEIEVVLLRANRSNQHWSVALKQGSEIQCSATCVFAKRRDTWQSQEASCPEAPHYDDVTCLPELPGFPVWVKQYDMRFVSGAPFEKIENGTESADKDLSESLLWIADKPARKLDFASLASIADAFFPRFIIRRRKLAPIGTVSLTVHFHATEEELEKLESGFVLGHARASKFGGSYFDQTAELWSEDKKLLATTSQMVYYKD